MWWERLNVVRSPLTRDETACEWGTRRISEWGTGRFKRFCLFCLSLTFVPWATSTEM